MCIALAGCRRERGEILVLSSDDLLSWGSRQIQSLYKGLTCRFYVDTVRSMHLLVQLCHSLEGTWNVHSVSMNMRIMDVRERERVPVGVSCVMINDGCIFSNAAVQAGIDISGDTLRLTVPVESSCCGTGRVRS
jgi:hypothetical protein